MYKMSSILRILLDCFLHALRAFSATSIWLNWFCSNFILRVIALASFQNISSFLSRFSAVDSLVSSSSWFSSAAQLVEVIQMTELFIINDDVINQFVYSIVWTLFSTIFESKEIKSVCFHADWIIDSLKTLIWNSLNAVKNSTFEKISSLIWTTQLIIFECQCFRDWKTHTFSDWSKWVVCKNKLKNIILWSSQ